jgi:hypothetical protein
MPKASSATVAIAVSTSLRFAIVCIGAIVSNRARKSLADD